MSKTSTTSNARRDTKLVRVKSNGAREMIVASAGEVVAGVDTEDADNLPLSAARVATLRRVPRVKTLRRALGLTQETFAARYAIPLGTLRDWEQGRSEPDQPARAYLIVIASDPEAAARALHREPA